MGVDRGDIKIHTQTKERKHNKTWVWIGEIYEYKDAIEVDNIRLGCGSGKYKNTQKKETTT